MAVARCKVTGLLLTLKCCLWATAVVVLIPFYFRKQTTPLDNEVSRGYCIFMSNEYDSIIANPFKNLTKPQIDIYYTLLNYHKHCLNEGLLEEDGSLSVSNNFLAEIHKTNPTVISRNIKGLANNGFIKLSYKPSGKGVLRYIFIPKEIKHG